MAALLLFVANPQPAPALSTVIRKYAAEHHFNGTVLVEQKHKTLYLQSFGMADRAFNVPITNDTKFRIASITKAFTSVLILQLYDDGKLDLHAPIKTYLPDYTGEGAERVTLHHLLNHTSGMRNSDPAVSYKEAILHGLEIYQLPHTPDELLAKYCSGPLVHTPGTVFDYDNGEYVILGKIVEKLTGHTFAQALEERILKPLGMKDTGMIAQQEILPKLATTYFLRDDTKRLVNDMPVYMENWYAAGGMYSTVPDLRKFADALYGGRLLKPETLNRMLTPGLGEYGYGLWVFKLDNRGKKYRVAQRPGGVMGANGVVLRFLGEDVTIVLLSNTNMTDIDAFSFLIGRALL
jgi:CubicO group peptidase (beta-lactamase class C family)